jgi:hypothetical protein
MWTPTFRNKFFLIIWLEGLSLFDDIPDSVTGIQCVNAEKNTVGIFYCGLALIENKNKLFFRIILLYNA